MAQTGCDKNGYVPDVTVNPGKVHDSTAFDVFMFGYLETVEDIRHTPEYQKLYERRKKQLNGYSLM